MNRREFILASAAAALGVSCATRGDAAEKTPATLKPGKVKKAAVVWYSQTGNTRRIGSVIAKALEQRGIDVTAGEMRDIDPSVLATVDLVVVGSPVFYMDVPSNVIDTLSKAPSLAGIAAASFLTFGGCGHNEHNTAVKLLDAMVAKGAAPVGVEIFGAMNSFPPMWLVDGGDHVLQYRDVPNETTYGRAARYADTLVENVSTGHAINPEDKKKFDATGILAPFDVPWWTKLVINRHVHDQKKCVRCGACVTTCPVGAVSIDPYRIDTDACIACFGCVNNCPADAIDMEFLRKKVVGYLTFAKQNNLKIASPKILTE